MILRSVAIMGDNFDPMIFLNEKAAQNADFTCLYGNLSCSACIFSPSTVRKVKHCIWMLLLYFSCFLEFFPLALQYMSLMLACFLIKIFISIQKKKNTTVLGNRLIKQVKQELVTANLPTEAMI